MGPRYPVFKLLEAEESIERSEISDCIDTRRG